ncbi:glycoside hydrolase family 3 N-terminal domain-containing protein [Corticibacter populi]|nr:glycoside hydrolase family 3 N-terminal domain-containing protein [Corticibacter populi]RZS32975.1 beta-N-acetylhexosaminidase [Corticibacter populi]
MSNDRFRPPTRLRQGLSMLLRALALIVLLALACQIHTPNLLRLRHVGVPALLLVAATGLVWLGWRARRQHVAVTPGAPMRLRQAEALMLALGLAAIMVITGQQAWQWRQARTLVLQASGNEMALAMLGRHFIVGYRDFEEAAQLATRGAIAGIYLSQANVTGRDPLHVRAEIMALQLLRERHGLPPLIVAADQEGGHVQHMSPPLPSRPALSTLLTADGLLAAEDAPPRLAAETLLAAYQQGQQQGADLQALGINLNLGPVADLRPEAGRTATRDRHTRLDLRAISHDPQTVAELSGAYMRGLASRQVGATLKHFPGLAGVAGDTHLHSARLDTPSAVLAERDWLPFRQGMTASGAIMLAHVVLGDVDAQQPASLSPAVVRLLRQDWGYQGLLMTDDLNMGAVYRPYGICAAALRALGAGVDLLLVSYDPEQFYPAMACALQALQRGELQLPHTAQTHQRLVRLLNPAPVRAMAQRVAAHQGDAP